MRDEDDFNPESREIFQQVISLGNAHDIAERINSAMQHNRKEAGDYVRDLFLSKGYFNGRMDGHVRQSDHEIVCWVEVLCFGLPRQCCRADRLESMDAALADAIRSPMGVVPDSVERYRSRWQRPRDV